MADTLHIHGLSVRSRVGVYDWEQASPQEISVDLELKIDAAKAAARDDVVDAIDYGRLVTAVQQLVQERTYRLLETVAEDIASLILEVFGTPQVLVRVTKRALPSIESAAVEIIRRKR